MVTNTNIPNAIDRQPDNANNLTPNKYRFSLLKLPETIYKVTEIVLPGISIESTQISNPVNYFNIGSGKNNFENFTLNFLVDENLRNYIEIFNWITGIGHPEDFEGYKKLIREDNLSLNPNKSKVENTRFQYGAEEYNIYSDATLTLLTNVDRPNIHIMFKQMFPISLTGLDLSNADASTLKESVTFVYDSYTIEAI